MIKIRAIQKQDIDKVFEHVYSLAANTGELSPDFVLTKEKLAHDLFCVEGSWQGLSITNNNHIIGSCLYSFVNTNRPFNKTGCLFLDTLFIEPKYRNSGFGFLLMQELKNIAKANKISRFEFWCLKDNLQANHFYEKLGATKVEKLHVYNLTID